MSSSDNCCPGPEGSSKEWIILKEFENVECAKEYLAQHWRKKYSTETEEGIKIVYFCKGAKVRGSQCKKKMKLIFHSDSGCVTLMDNNEDHTHEILKPRGILEPQKAIINQLLAEGKKPLDIQRKLVADFDDYPTAVQLKNHIAKSKT